MFPDVPTHTCPRFNSGPNTPYGTAWATASVGKSCVLTAVGLRHHRRPGFLNTPTRSRFWASMLIRGLRSPTNDRRCRAMYRNWMSRSACVFRASRLRCPRRPYPLARGNRPMVVGQARCPNAADNPRRLVRTHRSPVAGHPAVSGSTNLIRSGTRAGSFLTGAARPRQADAVGRAVLEVVGQLVPSPADGLGAEAGDGRDLVVPTVPEPLGLQGGDPTPLLLVEPAEGQVEAAVVLGLGAGAGPARLTRALVDGAFHPGTSW